MPKTCEVMSVSRRYLEAANRRSFLHQATGHQLQHEDARMGMAYLLCQKAKRNVSRKRFLNRLVTRGEQACGGGEVEVGEE